MRKVSWMLTDELFKKIKEEAHKKDISQGKLVRIILELFFKERKD